MSEGWPRGAAGYRAIEAAANGGGGVAESNNAEGEAAHIEGDTEFALRQAESWAVVVLRGGHTVGDLARRYRPRTCQKPIFHL